MLNITNMNFLNLKMRIGMKRVGELFAILLFAGSGISHGQNLLSNAGFEAGNFSGTNRFVDALNSLSLTTAESAHNASGNTVGNWGYDAAQWITDATRSTEGNRFLWMPGNATYCAGQELSFGVGQSLEGGRTYRFGYDWAPVSFNGGSPGDAGSLGNTGSTGARMELNWVDATGNLIGEIRVFEATEFINAFTGAPTTTLVVTDWNALTLDPGVSGSGWNRSYVDYTLPSTGIPAGAVAVLASYSNSGLATGGAGLAIDNATLIMIPEPSSALLLGLMGVLPWIRRLRRAA